MLWLDHLIFGDGKGCARPYYDDRIYWLVDTSYGRPAGKGQLYTWIGGQGAQLRSFEWRMPKPGTVRKLMGVPFTVFIARRRWLRVDVSWSAQIPSDIMTARAFINLMHDELCTGLLFNDGLLRRMDPQAPTDKSLGGRF